MKFKYLLIGLLLIGGVFLAYSYFNKPITETIVVPQQQDVTEPVAPVEIPQTQDEDFPDGKGGLVGASIPISVARFETSLQSSISDSATSMTLVSATDRAGNSLSGSYCFTIDEGTSVVEDVCGTASGTAISSLTRGISPVTGTSTVASLKFNHRRGASVKITDYPQLAVVSRILNGNETLPNRISYDSTIATSTFTTYNLVNKSYVDGVALQGAATATTTIAGIVQIATTAQVIAGTGMSGAYTLIPAASLYNATSSATTLIPVTRTSGKLSQGFLDLTESFTFSGVVIHSGTTTLATTTIANASFTVAPTAPTTTPVSSTTLVTQYYVDNNPALMKTGTFNLDMSTTTAQVITHNLGRTPRFLRLTMQFSEDSDVEKSSYGTYDGTADNCLYAGGDGGANSQNFGTCTGIFFFTPLAGGQYNSGTISAWSSTTFTISLSKIDSPTGNASFIWEVY